MVAVESGYVEVVKLLLKLDYLCDTNIQEKVFHSHEDQISSIYRTQPKFFVEQKFHQVPESNVVKFAINL